MGFKQPRLRSTTEDALACMEKHHIDAIAMDQSEVFADLDAHVEKNCPTMLRFDVEDTPEVIEKYGDSFNPKNGATAGIFPWHLCHQ